MADDTPDWTDQQITDARFIEGEFTLIRSETGSVRRAETGEFVKAMQLQLRDKQGEVSTVTITMPHDVWVDLIVNLVASFVPPEKAAQLHKVIRST